MNCSMFLKVNLKTTQNAKVKINLPLKIDDFFNPILLHFLNKIFEITNQMCISNFQQKNDFENTRPNNIIVDDLIAALPLKLHGTQYFLISCKINSLKTVTVDAVILWLQCQPQLSYPQTTIFGNASSFSAYKYFFVWNDRSILFLSGILTIARNIVCSFEQQSKIIEYHKKSLSIDNTLLPSIFRDCWTKLPYSTLVVGWRVTGFRNKSIENVWFHFIVTQDKLLRYEKKFPLHLKERSSTTRYFSILLEYMLIHYIEVIILLLSKDFKLK